MKALGITGGIGMGKSACGALLRKLGVPVVDTDDLARELVRPGQPALQEICARFGQEVLDEHGALRRGVLAGKVFADPESRCALEAILHPKIRESWRTTVREWQGQGKALCAVIIPLLFETKAEEDLDATVCVACSSRTQMERLGSRGWSAEQVRQRMVAQLKIEDKMTRSNYVIWSEGSLELHEAQLVRVLEKFADGLTPSS